MNCPYGLNGHRWPQMGYFWIETGGMQHSIHDTEACRDELLKIVYGVWDHVKNRCPHKGYRSELGTRLGAVSARQA